jgi:hypothetical protein
MIFQKLLNIPLAWLKLHFLLLLHSISSVLWLNWRCTVNLAAIWFPKTQQFMISHETVVEETA